MAPLTKEMIVSGTLKYQHLNIWFENLHLLISIFWYIFQRNMNIIKASKKLPLFQIRDIKIKMEDVHTLENTYWLNDEVRLKFHFLNQKCLS